MERWARLQGWFGRLIAFDEPPLWGCPAHHGHTTVLPTATKNTQMLFVGGGGEKIWAREWWSSIHPSIRLWKYRIYFKPFLWPGSVLADSFAPSLYTTLNWVVFSLQVTPPPQIHLCRPSSCCFLQFYTSLPPCYWLTGAQGYNNWTLAKGNFRGLFMLWIVQAFLLSIRKAWKSNLFWSCVWLEFIFFSKVHSSIEVLMRPVKSYFTATPWLRLSK